MQTRTRTQPPADLLVHSRIRPLFFAALAVLVISALLTACGGGDWDEDENEDAIDPVNAIDPAQLKGRWVTPDGATVAMTAVIMPDATGSADAWILAKDGSRLVKLLVRNDRQANGKSYALSPDNAVGQPTMATATPDLTATPKRLSFTGVNPTPLVLDQSETVANPAVQADVAGNWSTTLGSNSQTTQWTVAAAGEVTGNSTTGCQYTGSLAAMADTDAYKAQFSESCPEGAATVNTAFSGIATVNPEKNRLTITATNADETRGVAVFFARK
ncbi:hypothetical protein D5041_14860 [Verminephrobacter aporrectodeae subsp. tuberculatae]|nr:hypothetical protein [Verminephrobacter aporrectodeae subsp. tuberculatae]MCW5290277.1 hypothetical protein [Verminephrobacter aporrectodeae subsp. tuberculatae]